MARVELPDGIAAIHGRVGNMIFRSRKQADGTYKVFVHEYVPKKKRTSPSPSSRGEKGKGVTGIISRKRQVVGS